MNWRLEGGIGAGSLPIQVFPTKENSDNVGTLIAVLGNQKEHKVYRVSVVTEEHIEPSLIT